MKEVRTVSTVIVTRPIEVDAYRGFKIIQRSEDEFVAVPLCWYHGATEKATLVGSSEPLVRKLIWNWWNHAELDR